MTFFSRAVRAIAVGCALALSACGGGGGGGGNDARSAPEVSAWAPPESLLQPVAFEPAAASPPPASEGSFLWGVNGHPFLAYPGISFDRQLDLVNELGGKSYRVDLRADGSIPGLEDLLARANARGITILPILLPAVDFSRDDPEKIYRVSYEHGLSMAQRFRGRIPVWELGNEWENFAILQPCETRDDGSQYPCEWGPAGGVGALEYHGGRWAKVSAALKGLSDGVQAGDPQALRAMGTAGWGHVGAFERMQADGIEWDISVWHHYAGDPTWAFEILSRYGKPIWVTEFNHDRGGAPDSTAQADGIKAFARLYREAFDRYGVEAAFVYELFDEPYWGDTFEARMGLVTLEPDGRGGWQVGPRKPAFPAAQQAFAAE